MTPALSIPERVNKLEIPIGQSAETKPGRIK